MALSFPERTVEWLRPAASFTDLHKPELGVILQYFTVRDLCHMSRVNRALRGCSSVDPLWSKALSVSSLERASLFVGSSIKERYNASREPPKYPKYNIPRDCYMVNILSLLQLADIITILIMVGYFAHARLYNFVIASAFFFLLSPLCVCYFDWQVLFRKTLTLKNVLLNFCCLRLAYTAITSVWLTSRRVRLVGQYRDAALDQEDRRLEADIFRAQEYAKAITLIQSLSQSCPQALIQIFFLLINDHADSGPVAVAVLSIFLSLLSVSLGMVFMVESTPKPTLDEVFSV